jgi:hypothetical protein
MKKTFILSVCLSVGVLFSGLLIASDQVSQNGQTIVIAKRGCCSHHGGVCGCSGDMQQCCDGTISPSCGCGE